MKTIAVITGGASGMGFEVAKLLGSEHKIILADRNATLLEKAVAELKAMDFEADGRTCDISDKASVEALAKYAAEQGEIKVVIHAAGVSPHMEDGIAILNINAVGTIYIDEAFAPLMNEGCILNVASMSAYMLPPERVPEDMFKLALSDVEMFKGAIVQCVNSIPENAAGASYTISKNFVTWYTRYEAVKYGRKGLRVVSISPGSFRTPMGDAEGEMAYALAESGALGRAGYPAEIAKMMAFMVSPEASYLTGTDVLYDGGVIAGFAVNPPKF